MPNMSYCRFQNTAPDLRDCVDNMNEDDLSFEEYRARHRLIRLCVEIAENYGDEVQASPMDRETYEKMRAAFAE